MKYFPKCVCVLKLAMKYLIIQTKEWKQAVADDGKFISTYAKNYPDREDVAESATAWYAIRIRTDRQPVSDVELTEATIPNRMNLFDKTLGRFMIQIIFRCGINEMKFSKEIYYSWF